MCGEPLRYGVNCPKCGHQLKIPKGNLNKNYPQHKSRKKMKPVTITAIVFVLIILIIAGLFAYSYTQLNVSLNDVRFHSIEWTSLSWSTLLKLGLNTLSGNWLGAAFDLIDGVNLNLIFGLTNSGLLPVYIPDLSYDILVNGISVGKGHSNVDITINPGQTKEITSFQNIQKSSLSPAVYSIVSANGVMELKVKGTAYFKLFSISIPIPFESSKQISIYDEIRNKLSSVSGDDLNLSLKGQTIVDKTYKIDPGKYYYVYFTLSCTANLQGGFIASAALGDNIIVYIVDEGDFRKYENGQKFSIYYKSGKVESGVFDIVLSSGKYYIVMSNTYSSFSTKTVQLQAAAACT